MKAVILAAGRGERLSPYTRKRPKPLLRLFGRPLLEHVIIAFRTAGIKDFVIVTGYMSHAVRNFSKNGERLGVKIQCAHNPAYAWGNATSLKAAEKHLTQEEPFFLSMADHLFDVSNVKKALQEVERKPLLCVDRRPYYLLRLKEATKVLVDEKNYVRRIGKDLSSWNGVDTGLFVLDNTIFESITETMRKTNILTLNCCMKRFIKYHSLRACDVSGSFWIDIDTWEDLEHARRLGRT